MFGLFCSIIRAQTTEFTYQGTLKDGGNPANANYDFEFVLYDASSGGTQIGSTIPKSNILVTNGLFAVKLDFGSVFPGANRYLEVRVRPAGQPTGGAGMGHRKSRTATRVEQQIIWIDRLYQS
jgi:hypothetical protein